MNVGIVTRYQRHAATQAALHLADTFTGWGCGVQIRTPTPGPVAVYDHWDRRVVAERSVKFTNWITDLDVVLWTHCPPAEQVRWATRKGKRTILVGSDGTPPADLAAAAAEATALVVGSRAGERGVRAHYRGSNLVHVPWSPALAPVAPTVRAASAPVRIHLPVGGGADREQAEAAIALTRRMLAAYNDRIIIWLDIANWHATSLRRLARLERDYRHDRRLTVTKLASYHRHILDVGKQDLAVLLATSGATGLDALSSMFLGVPPICFDISPVNEFVKDGHNGLLVACSKAVDPLGNQSVTNPNYAKFLDRLDEPILARSELDDLKYRCLDGLQARRNAFARHWARLLGTPTG